MTQTHQSEGTHQPIDSLHLIVSFVEVFLENKIGSIISCERGQGVDNDTQQFATVINGIIDKLCSSSAHFQLKSKSKSTTLTLLSCFSGQSQES